MSIDQSQFHEQTMVRVTNHGPNIFRGGHANTKYTIEPAHSRFVPFHAACRWFGNPFLVNQGDSDSARETQFRTHEITRLGVLYGLCDGSWSTDGPFTQVDYSDSRDSTNMVYVPRPDGLHYHPNLPFVTVEDADGNPLDVVLNNPEGTHVTPAAATSIAEQRGLNDAVAEMQRQITQLRMELAARQGSVPVNPDFDDATSASTDVAAVTPEPAEAPVAPGRPTVDGAKRGPGRPRRG